MGCNKICQAKRKAARAKKQAEREKQKAQSEQTRAEAKTKNAIKNAAGVVGNVLLRNTKIRMITIAQYFGIDERKYSLTNKEVYDFLHKMYKSPQVKNHPFIITIGAIWETFKIAYDVAARAQKALRIVKPATELAAQIGNIALWFNFTEILEIMSDVSAIITQIMMSLFPPVIKTIKKVIFEFPLILDIFTEEFWKKIRSNLDEFAYEIASSVAYIVNDFNILVNTWTDVAQISAFDKTVCPDTDKLCKEIKIIVQPAQDFIDNYDKGDPIPSIETLINVNALEAKLTEYYVVAFSCVKDKIFTDASNKLRRTAIRKDNLDEIIVEEDPEVKKVFNEYLDKVADSYKKIELAFLEETLRRAFSLSKNEITMDNERYADKSIAETSAEMTINELEAFFRNSLKVYNKYTSANKPVIKVCELSYIIINKQVQSKKADMVDKIKNRNETMEAFQVIETNTEVLTNDLSNTIGDADFNKNIDVDDDYITYAEQQISNMKINAENNANTLINQTTVTDTADMILLRDNVVKQIKDDINNSFPDMTLQDTSVICETLDEFKKDLVDRLRRKLSNKKVFIDYDNRKDSLDYNIVDDKVNKMMKEVYKVYLELFKSVILYDAIPCRHCSNCSVFINYINDVLNKKFNNIKKDIIKNIEITILDGSIDWTINDSNDVFIKKNLLRNLVTEGLQKPHRGVGFNDEFIVRLDREKNIIIDNIRELLEIKGNYEVEKAMNNTEEE